MEALDRLGEDLLERWKCWRHGGARRYSSAEQLVLDRDLSFLIDEKIPWSLLEGLPEDITLDLQQFFAPSPVVREKRRRR